MRRIGSAENKEYVEHVINIILAVEDDKMRRRAQQIYNRLNSLDLSDQARHFIEECDLISIPFFFSDAKSAEDVEKIANDFFATITLGGI